MVIVLMFPPGHLVLGYFSGILSKKYLGKDFNLILIWFIALLPDIDLFIPGLPHRGPTHSIVVALGLGGLICLIYRDSFPYLISLCTHSVIGDYFTRPGCQLLWPLNDTWYKYQYALTFRDPILVIIEGIMFAIMIGHMILKKPAQIQ